MRVEERFLKYVVYDTQSKESDQIPSTEGQLVFARALMEELQEMGISDAMLSENGYLYGSIPSNTEETVPVIALIAHMDTAESYPGPQETPRVIRHYNGEAFPLESGVRMDPEKDENLRNSVGDDIIVTNGRTLLGGDDKAGVAEIMTALEYFVSHPEAKHGRILFAFTPDEETGASMSGIDLSRLPADFAYTVDGAAFGEIEYENFNAAAARIKIHGIDTHPGDAKDKMRNANLFACEFQSMLPAWKRPEHTEGYEGFYHLESIQGTCSCCELTYLIREADSARFQEMKTALLEIADYMNRKYGAAVIETDIKDSYRNMREFVLPYMSFIEKAKACIGKQGVSPVSNLIRGGTDGAALSCRGLPCPNLGTGTFNHHGVTEFANIRQMNQCTELLKDLLLVTEASCK